MTDLKYIKLRIKTEQTDRTGRKTGVTFRQVESNITDVFSPMPHILHSLSLTPHTGFPYITDITLD